MPTKMIAEVKTSVQLAKWAESYEAYRKSGMNAREWCRTNGIAPSSFYYRLRKIRENLCEASLPKEEHAVVPVRQSVAPTITVEAAGLLVNISGSASPESIRAVIEAMKSC